MPPDSAHDPRERWPHPAERSALLAKLSALPMSTSDAQLWMSSELAVGGDAPALLEIASEWSRFPLPPSIALRWALIGVALPHEAYDWYLRGFSPEQVDLMSYVLVFSQWASESSAAESELRAWCSSGLSARLALLGVAVDADREEFLRAVGRSELNESRLGTMALVAALRGVDLQALRIDWPVLAASGRLEGRRT